MQRGGETQQTAERKKNQYTHSTKEKYKDTSLTRHISHASHYLEIQRQSNSFFFFFKKERKKERLLDFFRYL
jgi:hypothetical protein